MLADGGYRVVAARSPAPPPPTQGTSGRTPGPARSAHGRACRRGDPPRAQDRPATREIPVIIVSVVDADDVPDLADGHIGKPVDISALLSALTDLELSEAGR